MLGGLFNYDNPVWRNIGKLWDVLVVHILWFICSIPIVTIGASTTALYYVTLKLARDEDGYTARSFFHSFKENFKQATIIWLLVLLSGGVLGTDLWFVRNSGMMPEGPVRIVFSSVFLGIGIIWLAVTVYVFPVLSRFYGSVKRIILNAFLMAIRHLLFTVIILLLDAALVFLALFVLPFLTIFGVSLIAYINSYFLNHIFNKYIPKEDRDDQELRPILEDMDLGRGGETGKAEQAEKAAEAEQAEKAAEAEQAEKAGAAAEAEQAEKKPE